MKHTIVVVDDHILIANAISSIIKNFKDFEVLFECANGKALQDQFKISETIPEIVLLDISMPIMDGYQTALWLKENYPSVLVMVLSMQDSEGSVIKMIRNGAKGYLLKNVSPLELENALKGLITNGFYYPEWASNIMLSQLFDPNEENLFKENELLHREKVFLSYCATELSYKEIAIEMQCSPRTLENYRDNLYVKLNVKSRIGLAVFAIKNGLT